MASNGCNFKPEYFGKGRPEESHPAAGAGAGGAGGNGQRGIPLLHLAVVDGVVPPVGIAGQHAYFARAFVL